MARHGQRGAATGRRGVAGPGAGERGGGAARRLVGCAAAGLGVLGVLVLAACGVEGTPSPVEPVAARAPAPASPTGLNPATDLPAAGVDPVELQTRAAGQRSFERATVIGPIVGLTGLVVGGIEFDATRARVLGTRDGRTGPGALRHGMTVAVHGSLDEQGERGIAREVRVMPEVSGTVTALNGPDGLVVAGAVAVRMTPGTVVEPVAGSSGLRVGDAVEVHGSTDPRSGTVLATRVEALPIRFEPAALRFRGTISGLDAAGRRFLAAGRSVEAGASVGSTAGLRNGQAVVVEGRVADPAHAIAARTVVVESRLEPVPEGWTSVRGGLEAIGERGRWTVGGIPVDVSEATFTRGGVRLARLGDVVEARGVYGAGRVAAIEARLVDPRDGLEVRASGRVLDVFGDRSFTLPTALIDPRGALVEPGRASDLVGGAEVDVTGTLHHGVVKAERIAVVRAAGPGTPGR